MSMVLLRNILHNKHKINVLINDTKIVDIDAPFEVENAEIYDFDGCAILPSLYNTHTHAAMTLLRGYADDMPLDVWLQDYIWPFEAGLKSSDIREGSEYAVSEMVSGGSVFFNDMYFDIEQTIDVVNKAGIRACLGITVMENHSLVQENEKREFVESFRDPSGGRIQLSIAPHAIYTVGPEKLKKSAEWARKYGLKLHTHIAETKKEIEDCLREHGTTPVRYLDSLGVLGPDVIAAHCVYVDEEEWDILAARGVTVSHCPCSNQKLGSGIFPYTAAIKSGTRITIGTDGASSNNNLDMREEMKFAALAAKASGDPALLPAPEVLKWATANAAEAFGIDAGIIAPGKEADFILVDLSNPRMTPCHNLVSNWVYSADSSCVRSVWCAGREVYTK